MVSSTKRRLPKYLYEVDGYFSYFNRATGRNVGLGRDHAASVQLAARANITHEIRAELRRAISLEQQTIADLPVGPDGLAEAPTIVARSSRFRRVCGVYFLMLNSEIVYVGKSVDCMRRVSAHHGRMKDAFDSHLIIEAPADHIEALEALYIAKFKPRLNLSHPKAASVSGHRLGLEFLRRMT